VMVVVARVAVRVAAMVAVGTVVAKVAAGWAVVTEAGAMEVVVVAAAVGVAAVGVAATVAATAAIDRRPCARQVSCAPDHCDGVSRRVAFCGPSKPLTGAFSLAAARTIGWRSA